MDNFISFIDFTNINDEEKYKLLNSKDYEIERLNNITSKLEEFALSQKNDSKIYESKIREDKIPKMYEMGICIGEQYAYTRILNELKQLKEAKNV